MAPNNETQLTEHEAELYDRQIRLWGLEAQKRLRASKILICGISGFGAEIAKNIILSGVKSVLLLDNKTVTEEDSCAQFLTPVTAIGKNRAEASLQRARALNPMVEVTADTDSVKTKDEEFFKNFDVVVITGEPTEELVRIDSICRDLNVKFFAGDVWGMFGYSFQDLIDHDFVEDVMKHKVISKPTEKIKTELVAASTKRNLKYPPLPKVFEFDFKAPSYAKTLKRRGPAFVILRILQEFRDRNGRDPCYKTREDDIQEILKIRDEIAPKLVGDHLFTHLFAQISPAAAIVGGQVAQEIIKAVSQKDAPLRNVFLFDPETCSGFVESIGVD